MAANGSPQPELTLPLENAILLGRLLRKAEGEGVELHGTKSLLTVTCAGLEFCSKLIDGTYPDYRCIIPKQPKATCEVDRDDLVAALKRLDAVADPERRLAIAVMSWGNNELTLSLDGDDVTAADVIAAETGGHCRTAAQLAHLLELLQHLDSDRVRLGSTEPGEPILFTAPGDASTVMLQAPCSIPAMATNPAEESDPQDIQQETKQTSITMNQGDDT